MCNFRLDKWGMLQAHTQNMYLWLLETIIEEKEDFTFTYGWWFVNLLIFLDRIQHLHSHFVPFWDDMFVMCSLHKKPQNTEIKQHFPRWKVTLHGDIRI